MAEEPTEPDDPRDLLTLKLLEAEVSTDDPWGDDKLGREEIAQRLTAIVSGQTSPFVISLHGAWGTGKTFMLKRWQRDLEKQGFNAIYFNAWEDDFCDDPLVAILGQLSDHFKGSTFDEITQSLAKEVGPLLKANFNGVLNRFTGFTLDASAFKEEERDLLDEYIQQRKTKEELKRALARLSANVVEETGHPLVFIIDELDRCRPTFTIELLERVKHIFDVSNVVFVLGINRDELCKSLNSVYGEVDADTYLRRFFDMEFNLPTADAGAFGQHLLEVYGLKSFARDLTQRRKDLHLADDLTTFERSIPTIWANLGLSLRDIDYSVRLTVLMCRLQPVSYTFPHLLGVLIALKITNSQLYHEFVRGDRRSSEVLDYIDGLIPPSNPRSDLSNTLASIECLLYYSDYRGPDDHFGDIGVQVPALQQLRLFADGHDLTQPQYLSQRTRNGPRDSDKVPYLVSRLASLCAPRFEDEPRNIIRYLANLIDLGGGLLRR